MECFNEIIGLRTIALYVNKDVRFNRPDISVENEVDLIAHAVGSIVISDPNEYPKWERDIIYSDNYKPMYNDKFTFFLHGIQNNVPSILNSLRAERNGYIVEIITTGGESFVFQAPVFLSKKNTKKQDSHSWEVSMEYRIPSFKDKFDKLNTMLMTSSYIIVGANKILGTGNYSAIVSN